MRLYVPFTVLAYNIMRYILFRVSLYSCLFILGISAILSPHVEAALENRLETEVL